jgi:hypothetical protein
MQEQAPADSSSWMSVRGHYGDRRSSHAQTRELRAKLARQLTTAAAAIVLTAALAACGSAAAPTSAGGSAHGSQSSSASGPATTGTGIAQVLAEARRVTCPPDGAGLIGPGRSQPGEPIPAGFRPVAVVECVRIPVIVPVTGGPIVEKRRVAFDGLGRLLKALRLPSTRRSRGLIPACLAPMANIPWLMLIGPHDQLIHPRIPIGLCGLPIVPVLATLSSLHWRTLGTSVVGHRLPT